MSRYIDANEVKRQIQKATEGQNDVMKVFLNTMYRLDKIPTADVRENVKGEWIPHDLENGEKSIDEDCCSVCGKRFREIAMTGCEWNFCPNCGADMRGEA